MRSHFVSFCLFDKEFKTKRECIAAQGFRLLLDSDALHFTGKENVRFNFVVMSLLGVGCAYVQQASSLRLQIARYYRLTTAQA
jgi:hypothetical protein